ncbi:hypothetical protein [Kingella kingae]
MRLWSHENMREPYEILAEIWRVAQDL